MRKKERGTRNEERGMRNEEKGMRNEQRLKPHVRGMRNNFIAISIKFLIIN